MAKKYKCVSHGSTEAEVASLDLVIRREALPLLPLVDVVKKVFARPKPRIRHVIHGRPEGTLYAVRAKTALGQLDPRQVPIARAMMKHLGPTHLGSRTMIPTPKTSTKDGGTRNGWHMSTVASREERGNDLVRCRGQWVDNQSPQKRHTPGVATHCAHSSDPHRLAAEVCRHPCVCVRYCNTKVMIADLYTKPMTEVPTFRRLRALLGIYPPKGT